MKFFDEESIKLVGCTKNKENLISLNDYLYFEIKFKNELDIEITELFEQAFLTEVTKKYDFFNSTWWFFLETQLRKNRHRDLTSLWILSKLIKRNKIFIKSYESVFHNLKILVENKIISPRISPDRKKLTIGFNFSGYSLEDISEKKMLKSSLDFLESAIEWIANFLKNNSDITDEISYIKKSNDNLVSEKELSSIYTF